jgi:arylsulfatase A-like enzyme
VAGLAVRNGRLAGRVTTSLPILHVERQPSPEDRDILHEVQVRARISAGTELRFTSEDAEKVDLAEAVRSARGLPWLTKTPLLPGTEVRTYVLRPPMPTSSAELRHLLLQPTDAPGATFEIESVRLVFRREFLDGVPSGVSWQGLSEIYRETLVAHAPERTEFEVAVPQRARLDLAVGTPEERPVTFRVCLRDGSAEHVLLEKTVTRPHRWEETTVDLAAYAGRRGRLALALDSDPPGGIGFWGAPTLRPRAPVPTGEAVAAGPPLGVILVWADTLRRDHLSAYGYSRPTSPFLERLAAEGVLFRDCVGHASWTKVATPSLMTSLYPTSHGVKEFSDRLPSSATTIAEVYREGGYATLSFSSIPFTGQFTNLQQGFEVVHEGGSLPDRQSSKTSREYVDRLLAWLEAHRDVPFLAFLHVSDPHDPYKPHPPYDTMWADPAGEKEHERQSKEVRKSIQDPLLKLFGMPDRAELVRAGFDPEAYVAYDRDWYDGSIREMDAEIGRLVQGLGNLSLRGRVLVVFTGDHGEEFLDHGRTFHGQSVYGEMNNVPLILWRPGAVPSGRRVDQTVRVIDVAPTLFAMSGLRAPREVQGQSLLPLFGPPEPGTVHAAGREERPAVSEKAQIRDAGGPPPRETAAVSIVLGPWKLVHNTVPPPGRPEFELFERPRDLLDTRDVAPLHPDVVARLSKELEAWKAAAEGARLKPDSQTAPALRPEELERLRSLGYVQ